MREPSVIRPTRRPLRNAFGLRTYLFVCFGVAVYPDDGTTPEQLLRATDAALSRAKHSGKNRVETATTQMV
jgi:GGDEF domain-containing protein